MDAMPRVSIIILNWNGWEDTIECLESVYQITYPNYDVIVVDNGSEDESIQKIREFCNGKIKVNSSFIKYNPDNKPIKITEYTETEVEKLKERTESEYQPERRLILIKNDENYGYAGGNNVAIKYALNVLNSDYILLLNNDTVVDREFLSGLIETAEINEDVGILGPKIYYYDDPKRIWSNAPKKCIGKLDNGECEGIIEVTWVVGCAFLIKKCVIEKVGFFDTDFFLYCEESDYCLRVDKAGYKMLIVGYSKIWHKESLQGKIKPYQIYYENRNNIIVRYKNYPYTKFYISIAIFFVSRFLLLLKFINNKKYHLIIPMVQGIKDGILCCYDMTRAGKNPYILISQ